MPMNRSIILKAEMMSKTNVFKSKKFVADQDEASELDLRNNCLVFYAAWSVFWQRTDSGNMIVLAKRYGEEDLVEMFQLESTKFPLPVGCGLVTICGEQTSFNNVCVLFQYSKASTELDTLLDYEGDLNDFAGAVILSKKDGQAINNIIDTVDAS